MSGRFPFHRSVARFAMIPLIAALGACTPKDINPVRLVDPHPGLPQTRQALPSEATAPEVTTLSDQPVVIGAQPLAQSAPAVPSLIPAEVQGDQAERLLSGDPWALRFLAIRRLAEENLLSPADAMSRFDADLGALLPLTQPPAPVGLDRPIPPIARIVGAFRVVPAKSERADFMLEEILPKAPARRLALNPRNQAAARMLEARLTRLVQTGLITPEQSKAEEDAIKELLASGRLPEVEATAPPPPAPAKAKHKGGSGPRPHRGSTPEYVPDPGNFETPKIDPASTAEAGVHLMSIPDPSQGDKAWTTLKTQYPELAPLSQKLVRTDLGDVGVTWRLIAGPLSAADATKLCEGLKAKGQNCTATPFPK
jgi:hypothetical protein